MTELDYKHNISELLIGLGWSTQPHEDMISNFIPDLSFGYFGSDGWIEVKFLNKIPKSLGSIPHYTYGQQNWLIKRGRMGSGRCYLWVGTPGQHYVWRWDQLQGVRDLPWADATALAMSRDTIAGMCRAMTAVVQQRDSY